MIHSKLILHMLSAVLVRFQAVCGYKCDKYALFSFGTTGKGINLFCYFIGILLIDSIFSIIKFYFT